MPIRGWQIWNEPNFLVFWRPAPSPKGYAHLLRISARAIHSEDGGAQIVAAGVAPIEGGMAPWEFLRRLLVIPGISRQIDVVALHPYAVRLRDVALQIRLTRREMARAGDGRMPLLISELGVASNGVPPTAFNRGLLGQAAFLRHAYRLLLRERHTWHVTGVDWYAWRDGAAPDPHCAFCEFAGLFDTAGRPRPSWWAYVGAVRRARSSAASDLARFDQ